MPLLKNQDSLLEKVEEQIMLHLARELEKDIQKINPILMDMILINQPSLSDFEEIEDEEGND